MIVRDARSPRGRYEDSGRRPLNLPAFFYGAGGTPWSEQNASGESRRRLFAPRQPIVRPPWTPRPATLSCEECGKEFVTTQAKLARLCSAVCRQRRYRRAKRAA